MADDGAPMLVHWHAQALTELKEDGFSYTVT
jgi:hypothetical protein